MGICGEENKRGKKIFKGNVDSKNLKDFNQNNKNNNQIEQKATKNNNNPNNPKEKKETENIFEYDKSIEIKKKTKKVFNINTNNKPNENKKNSDINPQTKINIPTERKPNKIAINNETKKEDIKKISLLKLKPDNSKILQIQKDPIDIRINSNYSINLKISIKKVKYLDSFSIILNQFEESNKLNKKLIGTSETKQIKPDQLVRFNHDFIVEYDFTKIQPLEFIIKMRNNQEERLEINLGELIGRPRQIYFHDFKNFELQIESIMHSVIQKKIIFLLSLSGNLKNMKLFYTISNLGNRYDNNKNDLVYKSDIMNGDSQIIFKQIEIPFEKLSDDNNLEDDLIQLHFFNVNDENQNEELGNEKYTLEKILHNQEIELKLKDGIVAKILSKRKNFYNLLQFLYNDFHLVTTFCIDFSENNIVHNKDSKFKDYLNIFLNLLYPYNSDKFFHCYAYGFKLLKDNKDYINEIFPLNRKVPSIEMNDIIKKYEKFLTKIEKTSEKTDLVLIIRNLNNSIKNNFDLEDKEYNVLIIFACNDIEDEEEFINELIVTSSLNISLIIIGIGSGAFHNIQNAINKSKGNLLKRDCVKFLKIGDNINEKIKYSLNNIPDAMIDFFCENNVLPKN